MIGLSRDKHEEFLVAEMQSREHQRKLSSTMAKAMTGAKTAAAHR